MIKRDHYCLKVKLLIIIVYSCLLKLNSCIISLHVHQAMREHHAGLVSINGRPRSTRNPTIARLMWFMASVKRHCITGRLFWRCALTYGAATTCVVIHVTDSLVFIAFVTAPCPSLPPQMSWVLRMCHCGIPFGKSTPPSHARHVRSSPPIFHSTYSPDAVLAKFLQVPSVGFHVRV